MTLPLLSIPLGTSAHQQAKFLAQQAMQLVDDAQRLAVGRRVYLNTLAVQAIGSYLQWQGYELDWAASDSQNPLLCARWDVADLQVVGLGKLEGRVLAPGEMAMQLSSQGVDERLGVVAVQLGESLNQAQLLGFASVMNPKVPLSEVAVADLRSLDDLMQYLHRLEQGLTFLQGADPIARQVQQLWGVWGDRDLSPMIAQLERIYRMATPEKWRYAAFETLGQIATVNQSSNPGYGSYGSRSQGSYGGSFRETGSSAALQDLAEQLLQRLADLWQRET